MNLLRAARLIKLPYYVALLGLGSLMAVWDGHGVAVGRWMELLGWFLLLYEAQVWLNDGVDAPHDPRDAPTWIRLGLSPTVLIGMAGVGTAVAVGGVWGRFPEARPFFAGVALLGWLYHFPVYPLKRVWPLSLALLAGMGTLVILAGYGIAAPVPARALKVAGEIGVCLFLVFGNKDRKDREGLWGFLSDPAARMIQAGLTLMAFLLPPLWWGGGVGYAVIGMGLGVLAAWLSLRDPYREGAFWAVFFLYALPTLEVLHRYWMRGV